MPRFQKVYLEITNCCNMQCSFCPGTNRAPRFMTAEEFGYLAAKLRPYTDYLYLHLMGEPLLHPQLEEILQISEQLGFHINITTNGTMLPQMGDRLLVAPALRKVSISLHSWEANDGGGEAYYIDCIDFAERAAAAGKLAAVRLWNLDGDIPGENARNDFILQILHERFPAQWLPTRTGFCFAKRLYLEYGERFEWPEWQAEESDKVQFCYALRDQMGVLCDGTVVPCCLDHNGDLALGNLFTQPLEEILSSPRATALYEGFSRRIPSEEFCRRCGYAKRFGR